MTAPELIWATEDGFGDNWWSMQEYDGATEYVRADLAAAQPDPRDEVIARLVEALGECRQAITDYMNQYPHMAKGYLVDAEQHARAALAAAKAVLK